jgi:triacylglycerol lipase
MTTPSVVMTAFLLLSAVSTAQAANYYNCAVNTGCASVSAPNASSTYAKTQYPVVFAHGMLGFGKIGPVDYWYGIPADLTQNGATVYVTKVSALNSSELRGEQLLSQVQNIVAISQKAKVNLMGHSHGGQSIRYVSSVAPQLVASATSVGSPHLGSPVADLISGVASNDPTSLLSPILSTVVNAFGALENGFSGGGSYSQDSLKTMYALSTVGAAAFNQKFPMGLPTATCGQGSAVSNGVRMYSWGGTQPLTNLLDPLDGFLGLTALAFKGEANDGLVGRCSNHFGAVIRDNYGMNHVDEINHAFGLVNLLETNPKSVFRAHANRLKNASL